MIFSAPILILEGSILLSPLLIWHDIVYLPNEYYCFIQFTNLRGTLWVASVNYIVPLSCLLMILIRIILFLRQQPTNLAVTVKQRQQRDFVILQRIFFNVGLLSTFGFPTLVFVLMWFVADMEYSFSYRIIWLAGETSLALLVVGLVFMTPQLKRLVMRRWRQNQVTRMTEGMMQMRTVASAQ